jgi:mannose-1-phosphate guanylyltransferase
MDYGVIMAGGSGTRLWPLSREHLPKQLLPVVKGKSLLRLSYDRLAAMLPADRIYICTAAAFRDEILRAIPELPPQNLLGEPEGRDTSNAVGFSAAVLHKRDPEATFAIVTADHVIEPIDQFISSLRAGFEVTAKHPGVLVTFGIVPNFGHTGLGYVERGNAIPEVPGSFKVLAFKEKPDKPTADRYVESRRYYWNSGMFVWRADTVLKELKKHLPTSHEGLQKIASAWGTADQDRVLKEVYPKLQKISVDYAIMEPASQSREPGSGVAVVEMPVKWLDVGSWPQLSETLDVDEQSNAVDAPQSVLLDSDNNIVLSRVDGHLITLIGVSDMVVAHTKDATLICPKNDAQRVKELVGKVKEKFGTKFI